MQNFSYFLKSGIYEQVRDFRTALSSFFFCYYCYTFVLSPILLRSRQFLLQNSILLLLSPDDHQLSFFLQFSKYILNIYDNCVNPTLPFTILQDPPICSNRQQTWPGLWRSHQQVNKATSTQPGSTYCYAYLNTIRMHAKQNPKLIYPPALSPPYPFRQNYISRIFLSIF